MGGTDDTMESEDRSPTGRDLPRASRTTIFALRGVREAGQISSDSLDRFLKLLTLTQDWESLRARRIKQPETNGCRRLGVRKTSETGRSKRREADHLPDNDNNQRLGSSKDPGWGWLNHMLVKVSFWTPCFSFPGADYRREQASLGTRLSNQTSDSQRQQYTLTATQEPI